MADDLKLYNPHDGLTGRDGGPYLDQVERHDAETRRAKIEGREPDYDNAPAVAGTPLVTASELVKIANPASNPSQANNDPIAKAVDVMADNDDFEVSSTSSIAAGSITGIEQVEPANANEDPTNPTGAASHPAQMPNADVSEVNSEPRPTADDTVSVFEEQPRDENGNLIPVPSENHSE